MSRLKSTWATAFLGESAPVAAQGMNDTARPMERKIAPYGRVALILVRPYILSIDKGRGSRLRKVEVFVIAHLSDSWGKAFYGGWVGLGKIGPPRMPAIRVHSVRFKPR